MKGDWSRLETAVRIHDVMVCLGHTVTIRRHQGDTQPTIECVVCHGRAWPANGTPTEPYWGYSYTDRGYKHTNDPCPGK